MLRRIARTTSLLAVASSLLACGNGPNTELVGCTAEPCETDGSAHSAGAGAAATTDVVVDTPWLVERLDEVRVIDARGLDAYRDGHIRGAISLDADALRATVDGVVGQVADQATVQNVLRQAGLDEGPIVVVYGAASEPDPARVAWTLAYYGYPDVRLLDGGWTAWSEAGTPTDTGEPEAHTGDWTASSPDANLRVDANWIAERLDDPRVSLIDARTASEYEAGHIPGALSVNWEANVSGGAYKPAAEVAALYATVDAGDTVVAYCQTGSRASLTWVTLLWLGYDDVRLYDGSWTEWSARTDSPRE